MIDDLIKQIVAEVVKDALSGVVAAMPKAVPEKERLLDINDLAQLLRVSHRMLADITHSAGFPAKVVISRKCHRWRYSEIMRWIAQQQYIGRAA